MDSRSQPRPTITQTPYGTQPFSCESTKCKVKLSYRMESLFEFLSRYFWAVAIAVNTLNTLILWWRSQSYIRSDPSLLPGYVLLTRGYWIGLSLPWLVMGAGLLSGGVPAIRYFLVPQSGNPFVLAWWIVWWAIVAFITDWVVRRGGAEMFITHPGFLRGNPTNSKTIKFFWLLLLAVNTAITIYIFAQPPVSLSP